ncbi:alpha/beta fold hydrolase [Phenylobacterium montanum]|uniref:Alpha/beta hydrolase n=1 Tax=Phenylobacterium montanum TaxID=2823693 RepID=A0A975IUK2_9CAUL|nr:alpha/beta hydrolase [Caulobacter sp. S6]QUD87614.1 alpha/beta hydrolase [Caulobacter sp. S6]
MAQTRANGIIIEYDTHGSETDPPLLLICGLGMQMIRWTPAFLQALVDRGFFVISFDNRDVGLSTAFNEAGVPAIADVVASLRRGEKPNVPYRLEDMAADAAGVLDALDISAAHIVGVSMGGMIAQLVAADYPGRTLSLTSIMSTTGNHALPPARQEAMDTLNNRPPSPFEDEEAFLAHSVRSSRVIGSPAYPTPEADLRASALAAVRRSYNPTGFGRQMAAVTATGDRRAKLATITAPTLVLHGTDDPLVPIEGGRDTAANIRGAELVEIPGMGHDLPAALYDRIADAIAGVASRASR